MWNSWSHMLESWLVSKIPGFLRTPHQRLWCQVQTCPGQVASDVCQLDHNGNPKVGTCWDGQLVGIAAITSILIECYDVLWCVMSVMVVFWGHMGLFTSNSPKTQKVMSPYCPHWKIWLGRPNCRSDFHVSISHGSEAGCNEDEDLPWSGAEDWSHSCASLGQWISGKSTGNHRFSHQNMGHSCKVSLKRIHWWRDFSSDYRLIRLQNGWFHTENDPIRWLHGSMASNLGRCRPQELLVKSTVAGVQEFGNCSRCNACGGSGFLVHLIFQDFPWFSMMNMLQL